MKNCGQTVHDEVASKQTMEELKDLLKVDFCPPILCEGNVDFSPEEQISRNIEDALILKQHTI